MSKLISGSVSLLCEELSGWGYKFLFSPSYEGHWEGIWWQKYPTTLLPTPHSSLSLSFSPSKTLPSSTSPPSPLADQGGRGGGGGSQPCAMRREGGSRTKVDCGGGVGDGKHMRGLSNEMLRAAEIDEDVSRRIALGLR